MAFKDFIKAIQAQIGTFNSTVDLVERRIGMLTARAQGEGEAARKAAGEMETSQRQLDDTKAAMVELKMLFVKVKKEWIKPADRVIGHVVVPWHQCRYRSVQLHLGRCHRPAR